MKQRKTAFVPARWGGGCRLEGKGSGPPYFPGYAGPGGKGNGGHPDLERLSAVPVPRGQDAAKRDSPQQVRGRELEGDVGGLQHGGEARRVRRECRTDSGALLFGGATVDSGLAEGLSGGFGAEVQCPRLRVWRECRLSVSGLLSLWWPSLNRVGQS